MDNSSPYVAILDDNLEYAGILRRSILAVTDRVEAVSNSEELFGLDLTDTKCVVLDFYLSETKAKYSDTGLEVLRRIHKDYPSIKVILHSAQAEARDIIESNQMGFYRYIPKGATQAIPLLVDTIRDLLPITEDQPQLPELPIAPEIAGSQNRLQDVIKARDNSLRDAQSLRQTLDAYEKDKQQFENVLNRASTIATSGERPGILLDSILDDLIERVGGQSGAWFLLPLGRNAFRNRNCQRLGRPVSMRGGPKRVLGSQLWQEIEEHGQKPSSVIVGPIGIEGAANDVAGIFHNRRLFICIFDIAAYRDKLIFVLEAPDVEGEDPSYDLTSHPLTLKTYVAGLNSILNILPLYISEREFGIADSFAKGTERLVSWGQVLGRGFMSLLSFTLFAASILTSVAAVIVLLAATTGFPDALDFMTKGFHWNPSHYAVGIVTALEIFILAITLYLLGIGLSCMIDHPRLSRVPLTLRYLDNPAEMKRNLILAISTLLAVAGLREILELDLPEGDAVKWQRLLAEFGGKMAFLILLILILTFLMRRWSGQTDDASQSKQWHEKLH